MIEDELREGLTRGSSPQVAGETKALHHRKMSFDVAQISTSFGDFLDDESSSLAEDTVDASYNAASRALDLNQEDGLLDSWFCRQLRSTEGPPGCWNDLSCTSVNGISVQVGVKNIETTTSQALFTQNSSFTEPLEGSSDRVLDLMNLLLTFGDINNNIGTGVGGTKAPDLLSTIRLPTIIAGEQLGSGFWVLSGGDQTIFDCIGQFVSQRFRLEVETIMFVCRFGQTNNGRRFGDSFFVGDQRL